MTGEKLISVNGKSPVSVKDEGGNFFILNGVEYFVSIEESFGGKVFTVENLETRDVFSVNLLKKDGESMVISVNGKEAKLEVHNPLYAVLEKLGVNTLLSGKSKTQVIK